MCLRVHLYVCTDACGGQRLTAGDTVLLNPDLTDSSKLDGPASLRDPSFSTSQQSSVHGIFYGSWGSKLLAKPHPLSSPSLKNVLVFGFKRDTGRLSSWIRDLSGSLRKVQSHKAEWGPVFIDLRGKISFMPCG